jgi:vancomycin resistance protein YoaR
MEGPDESSGLLFFGDRDLGTYDAAVRRFVPMVACLLVVVFPAMTAYAYFASIDGPLPGARVEGATVHRSSYREDLNAIRDAWLDTEVSVDAGPYIAHATRRALGARIDDAALEKALSRRWSPVGLLVDADRALRGASNVALEKRVDRAVLSAWLEELRDDIEIAPRSEDIDDEGKIVPPRNGIMVDFLVSLDTIERALRESAPIAGVTIVEIAPPQGSADRLRGAIFTRVVAEYTTRYSMLENDRGRATNIERSAEELDGAVVAPGETLSFNARVGPRTERRGFAEGPELVGGRLASGVGGGICQTAATLHAAAFFGGLDIVDHHPHPRASVYIPLGLDAAIAWRVKDFQVRNTLGYPVRVRASARNGTFTIALLGARQGGRVEWSAEVIQRQERGELHVDRYEEAPLNARGEVDPGADGMRVRVRRTVHGTEGPYTDEWIHDYPMVPRVVVGG